MTRLGLPECSRCMLKTLAALPRRPPSCRAHLFLHHSSHHFSRSCRDNQISAKTETEILPCLRNPTMQPNESIVQTGLQQIMTRIKDLHRRRI